MVKKETRLFIKAIKYLPVLAFKGVLSTPATVLTFFSKGLPASIRLFKRFLTGEFQGGKYTLNVNSKPLMESTAAFFTSMIISDYIPMPKWTIVVNVICLICIFMLYFTAAMIIFKIMTSEFQLHALKPEISIPFIAAGWMIMISLIICLIEQIASGKFRSLRIVFGYGCALLCMTIINVFGNAQIKTN